MEDFGDPIQRAAARPAIARAWAETAGVLLLTVVVGCICRPRDPFFVEAGFPWPVLSIILCGCRYGFVHGVASASVFASVIFLAWRWGHGATSHFPALYCTGLVMTGMLAGEFCDKWGRRIEFLSSASRYCRHRLDEFTRSYHLLKVSHDRLEHALVGKARSLRGAILAMRNQLFRAKSNDTTLAAVGNTVLELFSTYGWARVVSLFEVDSQGSLVYPACSTLGKGPEIAPLDVILREALTSRKMASVYFDSDGAGEKRLPKSTLLAAIPLVDVQGRIWGIVAVQDMPFVSFQSDNLLFLAVLGGYLGDALRARALTVEGEIDEAAEFVQEIKRSIADTRTYSIPAAIVGIHANPGESLEDFVSMVVSERRGLDRIMVEEESSGGRALLLLMPQTDIRGMEGYVRRLKDRVREEFRIGLEDLGVFVCSMAIDGVQAAESLLMELRGRLGVEHRALVREEADPVHD